MSRVYLDNAATSWPKPPGVWEAVVAQGQSGGANAGRSGYASAVDASAVVDEARARLARMFGAAPERVAFTLNTTDALNAALKGSLRTGDHVVTTAMEHNSVRRPLASLARDREIEVTIVPADAVGTVDPDDIRRAIRPSTRLVAVLHASNVCGTIQPIAQIGRICREHGCRLVLDAAQSAGSLAIDMKELGVDLLAVPGHKGLLGPLGTGALVVGRDVDVAPWREGGTGTSSDAADHPTEYPEHLEAGSPNVPGIAGLTAGLRWLEETGIATVRERGQALGSRLLERLGEIRGLRVDGDPRSERREPIFPVRLGGYLPDELASLLDAAYEIEARAGLHCAPGAHEALGSAPTGSVRISLGPFTTEADVDAAAKALEELASGR